MLTNKCAQHWGTAFKSELYEEVLIVGEIFAVQACWVFSLKLWTMRDTVSEASAIKY